LGGLLRGCGLALGGWQHFVDKLPMDEDPIEYLRRLFPEETYQSTRNRLGRYGLQVGRGGETLGG
jgi:hypothetical protein